MCCRRCTRPHRTCNRITHDSTSHFIFVFLLVKSDKGSGREPFLSSPRYLMHLNTCSIHRTINFHTLFHAKVADVQLPTAHAHPVQPRRTLLCNLPSTFPLLLASLLREAPSPARPHVHCGRRACGCALVCLPQLHAVTLELAAFATCHALWSGFQPGMICAGGPNGIGGRDACDGDSGGPLYYHAPPRCARPFLYFTSLSSLLPRY